MSKERPTTKDSEFEFQQKPAEVEKSDSGIRISEILPDGKTVRLIEGSDKYGRGYEIIFNDDEVEIKVFGLLKKDYPGARYDAKEEKYWAWSSSHKVGDYDDWQYKEVVKQAAKAIKKTVEEDLWFKEE